MYRILVVDDENYVVDWISSLLESQTETELDVCRAYSAEEALKWLNRAKIDIIITDISMPEMSGIQLAERVKQNWPQCKVILLTAYAEFDYAYEAIKNNVVSYILKTENDLNILQEVNKAVAILDRELINLQLLEDMEEKSKISASEIQKEIFLGILESESGDMEDLWEQLRNIGAGIEPHKHFLLLIGRIENNMTNENIVERFRKLNAIKKIAEHYFGEYFHCYPVEYRLNRIAWLMQANGCDMDRETAGRTQTDSIPEKMVVFVKEMLETIQHSCSETLGTTMSFVMHHDPVDAGRLSETFRNLNRLLNFRGPDRTGFIISDNYVSDSAGEEEILPDAQSDLQVIHNITEKLKSCLENNRQEEFMSELDVICRELSKCTSWHSHIARENYYSAAVAILGHINQRKISPKIAFKIGINDLFNPQGAGSWSNAAAYLRRLSQVVFDIQEEYEHDLSNNTVRFLKNYINEHISGDVSLVKLSEVTGYNTSYISRFFKEKTGETLNDYITLQRLNRIKELMLEESLNISDIALKAGFCSRTYFNRFVKKATNMSPQEYREHMRYVKKR